MPEKKMIGLITEEQKDRSGRLATVRFYRETGSIRRLVMKDIYERGVIVARENYEVDTEEKGLFEREIYEDKKVIAREWHRNGILTVRSHYDKESGLEMVREIYENGTIVLRRIYGYSKPEFTPIEIEREYYKDENKIRVEFFDEKRKQIRDEFYDRNGRLKLIFKPVYDQTGVRIRSDIYDGAGKRTGTNRPVYDERGRQIRTIVYDANGKIIQTHFFDENGELIRTE